MIDYKARIRERHARVARATDQLRAGIIDAAQWQRDREFADMLLRHDGAHACYQHAQSAERKAHPFANAWGELCAG